MMRHLTLVVGATLVALSVLVSGAHAEFGFSAARVGFFGPGTVSFFK